MTNQYRAPHDREAEQVILAGILLDADQLETTHREGLHASNFFSDHNRWIFEAMLAAATRGASIEPIALKADLQRKGHDVKASDLAGLITGMPCDSASVAAASRVVVEHAKRRHIAKLLSNAAKTVQQGHKNASAITADLVAEFDALAPTPAVGLSRSLASILADPSVMEPPEVVLQGLAWRGRVTLLAAREKLGKSTTAGHAAAVVSRGGVWLDEATPQGKVLWVSVEEHIGDLARRFVQCGASPSEIEVFDALLNTSDPLQALQSEAALHQPRLIVIDTLAAFAAPYAPDAGSSAAWTPIMTGITRVARGTEAAVLVLHHGRKSDGKYRDSSAIGAGVDVILEMSDEGQDQGVRKIRAKARWNVDDYSIRLANGRFELAGGNPSLGARVLRQIDSDPGCSVRSVREAVRAGAAKVQEEIEQLIARGAVEDRGTSGKRSLYPGGAILKNGSSHSEAMVLENGSGPVLESANIETASGSTSRTPRRVLPGDPQRTVGEQR